jgi:hypothetical protein
MKGYIYKISNSINDKLYVGSTTQKLSRRMSQHRSLSKYNDNKNRPLYIAFNNLGVIHFKIVLIEEVEVPDKQHLYMIEDKYINKYDSIKTGYNSQGAIFNIDNYRKYSAQYRENNKEHHSQIGKEWYNKNKERLLIKAKEYRERGEIIDKTKQYQIQYRNNLQKYTCQCGSIINGYEAYKKRHFKSKKHLTYINNI